MTAQAAALQIIEQGQHTEYTLRGALLLLADIVDEKGGRPERARAGVRRPLPRAGRGGSPMSAVEILTKAAGHMQDRASTYDKPEGERSMAQTVAIFNLYHDLGMTEAQGWHLLQILKDVRLFTRPGYHADSAEDCVAYAALKAEALHGAAMAKIPASIRDHCGGFDKLVAELQASGDWPNEQRRQDAEDVTIWPPEERIDVIGRNGNGGEHYPMKPAGCATCYGAGRVRNHIGSMECPACHGAASCESRP